VRIDLHTHSNVSDGTDSPAELMAAAAAAELDALALTDHDTTAGWDAAVAARPEGVRLVRGAELSCVSVDGSGRRISVHLLGYLFDPDHPAVVAEQRRLRAERRGRLHEMARLMAADGYPVEPDQLLEALGADAPAGRPHLARALVSAGVVGSVSEAFATLLHGRSPYYLRRTDTPVHEALELVAAAGGVSVLAHAFAVRGPNVAPGVIAEFAEHGLAGLEVDHPDHDEDARARLRKLAAELDLLPTGSSDYHGDNKATRLGAESTPPEVLAELVARASGVSVVG
jgi:predicted metal-dependent phosphoesterase TrpH